MGNKYKNWRTRRYFKYVDTIRCKNGKLRSWKDHDRVAKQERDIEKGFMNEYLDTKDSTEYWIKL